MTEPTHTKEAIRKAMDRLIDRAIHFDVNALQTTSITETLIRRW